MKKILPLLLTVALSFSPAQAALKKASPANDANPASYCNPHALPDDLILPMPNGLTMVLRPVAIPSKGFLFDKKFSMGLKDADVDRNYYEKRMDGYISAAFTQSDLPQDWQAKLPADEKQHYTYYFIGKYEISNAQWYAVMGGDDGGARKNLPKANISWYELQNFLQKYNEWLMSEHGKEIPCIEGIPGFLRLPTEQEWEFAARGGNIPPERQDETDFLTADGKKVEDYAVFGSRYQDAMPIGSKLPNNLGIHDMGGNLAELVQSGFRFTISDALASGGHIQRLHGSEGGLLAKGGSFLSAQESDVYPGKRVEIRMFEKQANGQFAPHKTRSLGARIVLSSINVSGMKRANSLKEENARLGASSNTAPVAPKAATKPQTKFNPTDGTKDRPVTIDPNGDPVVEIQKLYDAASSQSMRNNLSQFRFLLQDVNASLARERDEKLLSSLRSAVYKSDSLINIAFRCRMVAQEIERLTLQIKEPSKRKEIENQAKQHVYTHYKNLELSTSFYRVSLKEIAAYPQEEVATKLAQLRKEYAGDDVFNKNFRRAIDAFEGQLKIARTQGLAKVTNKMIWTQIIPNKNTIDYILKIGKELKRI